MLHGRQYFLGARRIFDIINITSKNCTVCVKVFLCDSAENSQKTPWNYLFYCPVLHHNTMFQNADKIKEAIYEELQNILSPLTSTRNSAEERLAQLKFTDGNFWLGLQLFLEFQIYSLFRIWSLLGGNCYESILRPVSPAIGFGDAEAICGSPLVSRRSDTGLSMWAGEEDDQEHSPKWPLWSQQQGKEMHCFAFFPSFRGI